MTKHEGLGADARRNFDAIVAEQLEHPDVTTGRMLQSQGLMIKGKVFAMLVRGGLGVKLSAERVTEEVDAGRGERLATRPDRPMREWLSAPLRPGAEDDWRALVDEARAFVGSLPPSPPRSRSRRS